MARALALISTRQQYDHLFHIYLPIAIGVFAFIVLVTLLAILIFRRRPRERAARWHENNPLEGTYAVLLACTAAFLLYLTFNAEHKVDTVSNQERPGVVINVVGSKWEWTLAYPAYKFSVRSGTVGRQAFVVPAGEAIRFNIYSADVIHSFWIPAFRYKYDAIPGRVQVTTLTFDKPGDYSGQCAEYCGLRHSDMVFTFHAVSRSSFESWARSKGKATP
jgi:cytochrome c oxidase subunit II